MTLHRAQNGANIAVIGGGYSGMAAAVRVTELGGRAAVFEAGRVLGGRARRIEHHGRALDNGQHILSGAYRELLRLMDLVGVSARSWERIPLNLTIAPDFVLRAPLLPAPLHMVWALLTASGLGWADRWRAARFMSSLKRRSFLVAPGLSVQKLLAQYGQSKRLIDYLWQPLTISALNTPIADASAQVFVNVLRDALMGAREASDLLLPKVDLSALFPEPAARWLAEHGSETKLGASVTTLVANDNNVSFDAAGRSWSFDAAIVAVAPHQRQALLPNGIGQPPPTMRYEPIVTIYLGFESDQQLPLPMLGQAIGTVQWFFDRRQLSASPEAAELLIAAVISASGPHEALPQDALITVVLDELRRHIPSLPAPKWQKVIHEKFATFACTPGVARLPTATSHPRIYLAGDDIINPDRLYPATLEGAVRNGIAAAEAAVTALHRLPPTSP